MSKKITVTFAFLLVSTLFLSVLIPVAHAQSPTPQESTTSSELQQLIRERLEQTLQETRNPTQKFIGTIGSVLRVTPSTFTLQDSTGRERTIVIGPDTVLLLKNAPVKLSDIAINAGAAVIGIPTDDVVITARRILLQDDAFEEERQVILGTVDSITRTDVVVRERSSGAINALPLKSTSKYEDRLGNPLTRADIEPDESVLIIRDQDTSGASFAKRVRLLAPVRSPEPTGN